MGVAEKKGLNLEEIRSYDALRMKELEGELRSEMAKTRMDVFKAAKLSTSEMRILKRNLARVLTVKNEKKKSNLKEEGKRVGKR